jgi:4-hydroxy-tetrahydrodipicolinate synthase
VAERNAWSGIFGVTVTPFTEDASRVDDEALATLVDAMLDDGIDRIVVNGHAGEYLSMTEPERRRVVEVAGRAAIGRSRLYIVGVGGTVGEVLAGAEHAAANGADAVMVHHPTHPFVSPDGLLAYLEAIAGATPLPLVPYLKMPLPDADVRRFADQEAVIAVKWGMNDLPAFAAAVAATRDLEVAWTCGTAELWAPFFWALGAVGYTSGLVNVSGRASLDLLEALEAGDRARTIEVWSRLAPFERLRARANGAWNVAVVKEAMRQVGRRGGPVRLPSTPVSSADAAEIESIVDRWPIEVRS